MHTIQKNRISLTVFGMLLLGLISCGQAPAFKAEQANLPAPKNIIFFIGDGMGYNHVLAANYFEYGHEKAQPYEQDDWTRVASATYPAVIKQGEDETLFSNGYSPRLAWSDPSYNTTDYTDSGAGGTALSTGRKTYNGSIGIGLDGDTLTLLSEVAKTLGKSAGVVSSVHMSHATPASFSTHNHYRGNYEEIARYMLFNTRLDLILAPGNPDFSDDAKASENNDRYVGGREIWQQLSANDGRIEFNAGPQSFRVKDSNGDGQPDPWTLIQTREDFVKLASGAGPARVLGIPQVNSTLQQGRSKGDNETLPYSRPLLENIPSLTEMTRAALNVLSQNDKGFFVMIEGGAIDWASHDNHMGRLIEEQIDLNNSIKAAIDWVETNSSWEETLIIITADHETGYLTGPAHPEQVNAPVVNNGKGRLPQAKFNFGNHTNTLVPLYVKGPGQELFRLAAGEKDPVRGPYLQNVQIPQTIFLMWGKTEY
ncbi:MAG: alkaline phosphatase [Bacteroidales bacterium]|nr:alkaline phosphatase [Bacteroidales bacterium]NLM93680.1 alkaline phosphatase [Bacteroidales bacterium]